MARNWCVAWASTLHMRNDRIKQMAWDDSATYRPWRPHKGVESMGIHNCLSRSVFGIFGVALAAGVGMMAIPQDAVAADKLVSEDEFSALFAPEPVEPDKDTVKKRGLAKLA